MPLFDHVSYHLSSSLTERTCREISRILENNGASEVQIELATHIISDTIEFEGCDSFRKSIFCVTPYWVERSMELGQVQDPKYFSADKEMFFSGIVATSADLLPGDKEMIACGILEQGGAWREGLTRDVTHLFVLNTNSEKYKTAMHFREAAHITIVLPHWFDQCWSTQMLLPPDVFQFPDPPFLRKDHDAASYKAQMLVKKEGTNNDQLDDGIDKQVMFRTMDGVDKSSPAPSARPVRDIWGGRKILLSRSLSLDAARQQSIETRIKRDGGIIMAMQDDDDESVLAGEADVLVTRYRAGAAYSKARIEGKTIGTLAWLLYVERRGVISRPRDQLLHYPVRPTPVDGFNHHEITVTNYQGDARDYLKKLIELMGAKFTPTMSGRNTVVIAAYKSGNKTAKAEEWSVPVVTHKWLEDCFVEWRNLTPAQKKYVDYAPGMNYGTLLGERGIGRVGLEEDPELPPEAKKEPVSKAKESVQHGPKETIKGNQKNVHDQAPPPGTAASMQEAEEVEVALDVGGHDAADIQPVLPIKIGPPRGIKPSPTKIKEDVAKLQSKSRPQPLSVALVDDENGAAPRNSQSPSSNKAQNNQERVGASLGMSHNAVKGQAPSKDVTMSKIGPPVKPKSKPKAVSHTTDSGDEAHDGFIVEVPLPRKTTKSAKKDDGEAGTTSKAEFEAFAGLVKERISVTGMRKEAKDAKRTHSIVDVDEEEHREKVSVKASGSKGKGKGIRLSTPTNLGSDDELSSTTKRRPSATGYQSKAGAAANVSTSASETDDDNASVRIVRTKKDMGKSLGKGRFALQPSPSYIVSVDLPDPRSLLVSRSKPRTLSSDASPSTSKRRASPTKPVPRTNSLRTSAQELPVISPKRAQPLQRRDTTSPSRSPTPPPRRSPRRPAQTNSAALLKSKPKPDVHRRSLTPTRLSLSALALQRTPSRRSAAITATQKLHNKVMPDVVSFESEHRWDMKNIQGRRRKSHLSTNTGDEDDDESVVEARPSKKQKVKNDNARGKDKGRGKSVERLNVESDGAPSRFVTHSKDGKRFMGDTEESDVPGESISAKKARLTNSEYDSDRDEVDSNRSSWDPKKIRVLKTKVEISEDVEKTLVKLGIRFTQKPHECTHLVSSSMARTEKFLCALPNAPYVLDKKWLVACAETNMILAERKYTLRDPDTEHKFKFKLTDALQRARALKKKKQKLLQGHFFYITPNVPIQFDMLKTVLRSLGAECKASTPTIRNISETRHVISSLKDQHIWRSLAKQGIPIYSHELVLMAAFEQYVDWNGADKRLPI